MAKIGQIVKQGMIDELAKELQERPNVFVTQINKLTAADAGDLRKKLHASQARMIVVKRRLGLRTLEQLKLTQLGELLDGSIGLILSAEDPSPIAKDIYDFMKEHEGQLTLRGGLIEGELLDQKRVETIAKLPAKPQLLAEVAGTLEAPLQDVLSTIERLLGDLAYAIEQLSKQKPAEAKVENKEDQPQVKKEEKAEAVPEESKPEQKPPTDKKEGDA